MLIKRYDLDSLENRNSELVGKLCGWLKKPLNTYFRAEVRGLERITRGAGLYVGNHSSGLMTPDSFIFCAALYEKWGIENMPYGLGHEVAISIPVVHEVIVPLGAVRASHTNAHRLFKRGNKVIVYPGGDLDAMRPFRHRNRIIFGDRKGYIRLAVREGVPIIPVVSAGSHGTFIILDDLRWLSKLLRIDKVFRLKVFPLTLSIPWGLTLGPVFPYVPLPVRITIEVLEPIQFERSGDKAADDPEYVRQCAAKVELKMQETLTRLTKERKKNLGKSDKIVDNQR